jgi:hypothetical protein
VTGRRRDWRGTVESAGSPRDTDISVAPTVENDRIEENVTIQ